MILTKWDKVNRSDTTAIEEMAILADPQGRGHTVPWGGHTEERNIGQESGRDSDAKAFLVVSMGRNREAESPAGIG